MEDEAYYHAKNETDQRLYLLKTDGIMDQLQGLSANVESGHLDALDAYYTAHLIEKVAAEIKREIQDFAVTEADKYAEKTIERNGIKFTKMDGKATYSYKHIKEWQDAEAAKKKIEEAAKTALKMAQDGKMIASEDGEVIETAIVKYSKPTLSVTIPK